MPPLSSPVASSSPSALNATAFTPDPIGMAVVAAAVSYEHAYALVRAEWKARLGSASAVALNEQRTRLLTQDCGPDWRRWDERSPAHSQAAPGIAGSDPGSARRLRWGRGVGECALEVGAFNERLMHAGGGVAEAVAHPGEAGDVVLQFLGLVGHPGPQLGV